MVVESVLSKFSGKYSRKIVGSRHLDALLAGNSRFHMDINNVLVLDYRQWSEQKRAGQRLVRLHLSNTS